MNWDTFNISCAALCCWREARGQGRDGLRGVLHVIANRSKERHMSWAQVVYESLQFSSMTYPKDGQLCKVPVSPDPTFVDCMELAELIYAGHDFDLTNGADHYFADYIPVPTWAEKMKETARIGRHIFFKA